MENKKSFLDKFIDKITEISEPLGRFARTPIMASIQDGMAAAMPLIIIGSFFLILGAATDGGIGFAPLAFLANHASKLYLMYTIGMGFMGLYFAVASGIAYAKRLDVPVENAALLVISSYLAITFNDFANFSTSSFSAANMFVGLLASLLSVKAFSWFLKKNVTIKLPPQVPANIAGAFTSLIPYAVILIVCWIIRTCLNIDINAIFTNILAPIVGGADNIFAYTLDRFLAGIFWSVGLHYDNMTTGITGTLMLQWIAENAAVVEQYGTSVVLPHIWTYAIHNWSEKVGYVWPLVIMLLTSKAPGFKEIGKSVFIPSIFCICEPLWFSVPVILNPYMMFGLVAEWTILGFVNYLMFMLNLCTRPFVVVPWACPDILAGYLTTGGDWRFLIILGVNFVLGAIIWFPFFKAYERKVISDSAQLETAAE